jgi:Fe2+ or Zn2+ uptake regulation protein
MTTLTTPYSFMDLLKEYNYVPEANHGSSSVLDDVKNAYESISESTSSYSFMDLLKDKGQVPEVVANDNSILNEIESGIESIIEFVEESADYTVIDLLKEKQNAQTPVPANDNAHYMLQAS